MSREGRHAFNFPNRAVKNALPRAPLAYAKQQADRLPLRLICATWGPQDLHGVMAEVAGQESFSNGAKSDPDWANVFNNSAADLPDLAAEVQKSRLDDRQKQHLLGLVYGGAVSP